MVEQEYRIQFEVDGAVSHGFGIKYPDTYYKVDLLKASSDEEALKQALKIAKIYANDGLSNPDTGFTTVKINFIRANAGRELDLAELSKNLLLNTDKGVPFVRTSDLEHLLLLMKQ